MGKEVSRRSPNAVQAATVTSRQIAGVRIHCYRVIHIKPDRTPGCPAATTIGTAEELRASLICAARLIRICPRNRAVASLQDGVEHAVPCLGQRDRPCAGPVITPA